MALKDKYEQHYQEVAKTFEKNKKAYSKTTRKEIWYFS